MDATTDRSRSAQPANTTVFRDWLRHHRGLDLADYEALRAWSVDHVSDFWQAVWDYFAVASKTPHERALTEAKMPGARWFVGAEMSYAAHLLRHVEACEKAGVPAILFRNERMQRERTTVTVSWAELADQVGALAASLQALGVTKGDRVAAYLPSLPETIVAFLACASLGAIWSMCATDMGVPTVRDRFAQITPKVLIAVDGTVYGGKTADRRGTVAELLSVLPSLEALVLIPYLETSGAKLADGGAFDARGWPGKVVPWSAALAPAGGERIAPRPVPFEHPLWIVYSSGTTGMPKPIVHGHGGVLLEQMKLHAFHFDLRSSVAADGTAGDERFSWFTSSGWVMWNLAISALLQGTTFCLYEGNPAAPARDSLWAFAADLQVTTFGAGAAYYAACLKDGVVPANAGDLSRIRTLGATGSPLSPECYRWGQEQVRSDVFWAVICGGTDVASAFLGGTPELPTVPGEMQARCLGCDVQVWDEAGKPLVDEVGELVLVQPMPSMPLYFWNDEGGRRFHDSYFDVYPGIWRHGDWMRLRPDGSCIVYGRSDATLNRHGHRLGTAELYNVVEALPEVTDSLVADIEYLGHPSWMPLFVVLGGGKTLDATLEATIRSRIRESLSPRFVPDEVIQVPEIPRTLTGKKQELPVKKLLLGRALAEVVNKDACANPAAFDPFEVYATAQKEKHEQAAGR